MHNDPTLVTFKTLIQSLLNEVPVDYAHETATSAHSARQLPESVANGNCEPEIRTEVNHEVINNYLKSRNYRKLSS